MEHTKTIAEFELSKRTAVENREQMARRFGHRTSIFVDSDTGGYTGAAIQIIGDPIAIGIQRASLGIRQTPFGVPGQTGLLTGV